MSGNQEANGSSIWLRQPHALNRRSGKLQTVVHVIGASKSFADIVQQQREKEQVWALQLRQQLCIGFQPLDFLILEPMQDLDGEKAVLVDRVAMVQVAEYERINCLELGNGQRQQLERVHGAQSISGVRCQ